MAPQRRGFKPLDGGWGWVVVVASFGCVFLLATCVTSFAILQEEFRVAFSLTRWQVGWVGSVQLAVAFVNSIPAGVLVQVFGCRAVCMVGFVLAGAGLAISFWAINYIMLFMTYGVITGLGMGLAMLPVFLSLQLYFEKHRGLALGIALCGINLSSFVTGPLMRMLVDWFGWRGASLLHAGAIIHGVLFACTFRPLELVAPSMATSDTANVNNPPPSCWRAFVALFDFKLLTENRFMLYTAGNFLVNFSGMTFHQHLVSFGIIQGLSKTSAALLPTVIGVCSTLGRIVSGVCGDRKCVDRRYMCGSVAIVSGAVICFSFLGTDMISIGILSGLFGAFTGIFSTLQFTVLVDLVGVLRIAQAQAFFSAFMGSSSLFSGPLSGYLVDRTGDYNLPFFINGILHVAGGAILLAVGSLHLTHVTSTSGQNGHVTENGHIRDGGVCYGRVGGPEKVELIITTV